MRSLARAAAIVAGALAFYWLCVLPYHASAVEVEVQRRSAFAEKAEPQRAVIMARENLAELDRIARVRRLDASWYMLYGGNYAMLDRWPEAVDAYSRALAIEQRPEIYFNRGLGRLHLGQTDAGIADMVTAVRFNPQLLDQIDGELRARVAAAAGIK